MPTIASLRGELTCPDCGNRVRGDWMQCPYCHAPLVVNEESLSLQNIEDLERVGCCPCCSRPLSVCDAAPCIQVDNGNL